MTGPSLSSIFDHCLGTDSASERRIPGWIFNIAPTIALMASLFAKYVSASLSLEQSVPLQSSVVSAMVACVSILTALLVCLSRTKRFIGALLVNFSLTVLLLADTIHLRFFGDILSVAEFPHAWQITLVASSVFAKIRVTDILYFTDIFGALIAWPVCVRLCPRVPDLNCHWRAVWSSALLLLGFLTSIPTIKIISEDRDKVFEWRPARRQFVGVMGFLPYHLYDIVTHVKTAWGRFHVTESQLYRVRLFLSERRQERERPSTLFGVARGRNVIIVMVESLQAFPIDLQVDKQSVTPTLDAFAKESLHFVNFYDQTYEGGTSDAEFTSLQSLHPVSVGAIATRYDTNQYRGLPAILADHGYRTLAAVGTAGEYWNMRGMQLKLGFHQSYFEDRYPTGERFGQGLSDRDFFRQTLPLLETQAEPFTAFLITLSSHHPYDLPRKYQTLNLGGLEGSVLGKYLHSLRYFDDAFGEFVDRLRQTGLLDQSIVVVFGDHQAWGLERPAELARLLGFPETSKYDYWKVRKKVPLLIRLPNGANAGAQTVNGGHLDIAPTLLSLLGIREDNFVMFGTDLTQDKNSLVVFRDGGFADGWHYFIDPSDLGPDFLCYEVQTDRQVSCESLRGRRRQALEQLEISDLIIQGNLVPAMSKGSGGPIAAIDLTRRQDLQP